MPSSSLTMLSVTLQAGELKMNLKINHKQASTHLLLTSFLNIVLSSLRL